MKTLNKKKKKLNTNFPKPTSLLIAKPYPTKVSYLPPPNKARKQTTITHTMVHIHLGPALIS